MIRRNLSHALVLGLLLGASFARAADVPLVIAKSVEAVASRPAFVSHDDWFAVALDFTPVEKLRSELEKRIGKTLLHRGEAHLTLVTPPEWSILSQVLRMKDVEALAEKKKVHQQPFRVRCVKKVSATLAGAVEESWFVAVSAPELLEFRKDIWRLYMAKGGPSEDFKWRRWVPHITLGFTKRDLYDEDLVNKERADCAFALTLE